MAGHFHELPLKGEFHLTNSREVMSKMISAEHSSNSGKNKVPKKPHSMVIF